jgi:hypothetical protein
LHSVRFVTVLRLLVVTLPLLLTNIAGLVMVGGSGRAAFAIFTSLAGA